MRSPRLYRIARTVSLIALAACALALLAGCPANGLKVYLTRSVGFDGNIYVSVSTGNDENDGRMASPLATIQAGITLGQWYLANGVATAVSVLVAEGTYEVDDSAGQGITIVEGVSLYGGYSTDFSDHDPDTHVTTIKDLSETGEADAAGGNEADNVAIVADGRENAITTATVIDGFTIIAGTSGSDGSAYAILCETASPTISNNVIDAGGGPLAMFIYNGSSPTISGNTIMGSILEKWTWKATVLVLTDCNPVISGNTIEAVGDAVWGQTAVRVLDNCDARIADNVITASTETVMTYPAEGIAVGPAGAGTVGSIGRITSNTITAPVGVTSWGADSYVYVNENTITCTNSTGYARGIEARGCQIRDNTITCDGTGSESAGGTAGIVVLAPDAIEWISIERNTISAMDTGGDPYWVVGVQIQEAGQVTLSENVISAGPGRGGQGVQITNTAGTDIHHNIITTTGMAEHVAGLDLVETPGTIEHNLIAPSGSLAEDSQGVSISGAAPTYSDIRIRSNTIYGGGGSASSYGIRLNDCNLRPEIDNNIIFTSSAVTIPVAIQEQSIGVSLKTLRNNLFFRYKPDMELFYDDEDLTGGGSVSEDYINNLDDLESELTDEGATAENNIDSTDATTADPDIVLPIFVDIEGPDDDIGTMDDNDWHLATEVNPDPAIYGGGRTVESGATDLDGVARTEPWSIGAYEYDG
jgi:parallel beta helix pectate lyase-like protein